MKAQDYIISTLEALKEPVVFESVDKDKLEEAIYAKAMSKKFRKLKAAEKAVIGTENAIKIAVTNNQPIRIMQMFGGNKLWRFEEAPEIDWAELFSLIYFMQWSKHIASVYEPGVLYEYFSQDISVESLNNIPRSETDRYSQSFRDMLKWIKPYLPNNVQIKYVRHYDLFNDPKDYNAELEVAKKQILKDSHGKLPTLTPAMKAATELNVKLKPNQDKDPKWREYVELQHQAIFATKTLREYTDNPDILWTCPTFFEDSIVTGSTKSSYAKFWAGVGALRPKGDSYDEIILTPKQLEHTKYTWESTSIQGLTGKNFSKIRILNN